MTKGKIDPRYGNPSATPPTWEEIARLLTDAQLYWIVTVRADGRPHAVPLVGVWHDGAFAFCTGADEQKQRNLDAGPDAAVTTGNTGADGWNTGKDVVVEGTAVRVTDPDALQELAGFDRPSTPSRSVRVMSTRPHSCCPHPRGWTMASRSPDRPRGRSRGRLLSHPPAAWHMRTSRLVVTGRRVARYHT